MQTFQIKSVSNIQTKVFLLLKFVFSFTVYTND